MAFPKCFKGAAKRKSTTIIPMVLLFIISIIILVLSVQQLYPIVSDYVAPDGTKVFENWDEEICQNVLLGFLSPFLFNLHQKVECDPDSNWFFFCAEFDADYGLIGCPWRERNTIFRLVIDSLVLLATIVIFAIIITEKGKDIWPVTYWFHWILMLLMFVIFILDCDGLYSGYNSCLNEFNLDGSTALYFVADSDSSSPIETTIDCKLAPFIYTCLADLAAVIFGFCVWRISMFYKFDQDINTSSTYDNKDNLHSQTTKSPATTTGNEMAVLSPNQSSTGSVISGNIVSPPTGSRTMTATPNPPTTSGQTNKKEDSPDPFEEFNTFNNGTANDQETGGTEDYVNPFDD